MRHTMPANMLGGDLIWWREGAGVHTLVTLAWELAGLTGPEALELHFVLHDESGGPVHRWTWPYAPGDVIVIDSARLQDAPRIQRGVLGIFATGEGELVDRTTNRYSRLYSLVDWYSDDGELVALHNDHSLTHDGQARIELTEMVVHETRFEHNSLVFANGYLPLRAGGIKLHVRNHRGETREIENPDEVMPFTIVEIELRRHIEGILDFVDDKPATVEGLLDSPWLFARPWVMTRGTRQSGYHGGDRYSWRGLRQSEYDFLGRGEVNPMAVVRRAGLRTHVNVFNSHDDGVEGDQYIDARLYSGDGTLVTSRDRWLAAPDQGADHGDLDGLIPGDGDFTGHVSLTFTPKSTGEYPRRLQALMEYRTDVNTSRVMAWSDTWSTPLRLLQQIPRLAGYRVWARPSFTTYISITNAGPRPHVDGTGEYEHVAEYSITLRAPDGRSSSVSGVLAPHATRFASVYELFPEAKDLLGELGVGWLVVESFEDLALVQFTHHDRSGVWSAEHFMAVTYMHKGRITSAAGS